MRPLFQSPCWPACTSSCAWMRPTPCPMSTPPGSRRGWWPPPGPGTTTSPTRCLPAAARNRHPFSRRSTARRSPRPTRKTCRRLRPWPTCTGSRGCSTKVTSTLRSTRPRVRRPMSGGSSCSASGSPSRCHSFSHGCRRWVSRSSTSGPISSTVPDVPPPGSMTSGCATSRRATALRRTGGSASRTPSRRSGPARRRATASTLWCCVPVSAGARPWCCVRTRSICGRAGRRSARTTSKSA